VRCMVGQRLDWTQSETPLGKGGFCARSNEDSPPERRAPLAEQARDRDHDSSDECKQAGKQHKVTQERTHARASPSSPPVRTHVGIPKQCRQPVKEHLIFSTGLAFSTDGTRGSRNAFS
jgi:hypothetical protein